MTGERSVERFREALRIPTISRLDESLVDFDEFDRFIRTLELLYPLVHATLERELVEGHSLLYRWAGRDATEPVVLMAHYDVVSATDRGWEHPPFEAHLVGIGEDATIWGRGTLDDKGALIALLEAVEAALVDRIVPTHDVYLVFGHNEETTGTGAAAIAAVLAGRRITPLMVLDEGGAVVRGAFPGVAAPAAAIGISEKGTSLIDLVVTQQGGHASTPPRLSATARLARAIVRLNEHPFPARLPAPTREMFAALGPHATGVMGWAMRGGRLTAPLVLRALARGNDETRAIVRTTQAVTILEAGQAANALAERARATVNLRVAVGSTVDAAVAHVRRVIRDDEISIDVVSAGEPAPVSPTHGHAWALVTATIAAEFPGTVIVPYVQNGATDSRHFAGLTPAVYRFVPFDMSREERETLHAVNERIRVSSFLKGIGFYRRLLNAL